MSTFDNLWKCTNLDIKSVKFEIDEKLPLSGQPLKAKMFYSTKVFPVIGTNTMSIKEGFHDETFCS